MSPDTGDTAPMSELGRITGVFFEPKKAFTDIAARPRWFVPMLLVVIASLIFVYVGSQRIGWERIVRQGMESSPRTQQLSPEQREQAVQTGARFAPVFGYVVALIGTPVGIALIAAVLMLTARMFGARLTYQQMFAITTYSSLTGIVFVALGIVVMYLKNPDDFNMQNPLAFNLGAFFDPQTSPKALVSLAGSLDLFSFWRMALIAVGISAGTPKVSFGKAFAAVLLPWAVLVAVKVGWVAMFS
jgi:hypothetical protein